MRIATIALIALMPLTGSAQNIERIKLTDNELGCRQIHDELGVMDKAVTEAKQAQASADTTTTAGQVGGVAAEVASRTGLFGQVGGLWGHVAGTVASKAAADVTTQTGKQGVQQDFGNAEVQRNTEFAEAMDECARQLEWMSV